MEYSDDDISVSDDELGMQKRSEFEMEDEDDSGDDQPDQGAGQPEAAAAAAAATAAGSKAHVAPDKGTLTATQNALLGREISTNAALLQLQLDDLLAEIALCKQPQLQSAVEGLVRQLADALAGTPTRVLTADADEGLAGMISSWGLNPGDVSCSMSRPQCVQLVGSWALKSAAKLAGAAAAAAAVDVAVQLPTACCHHKDILNFRYHAKRAVYLSALSQQLAVHPIFKSAVQQLAPLNGDPCKPALLLHLNPKTLAKALQKQGSAAAAAGFGAEGLVVRLLPVVGLDAFELSKLAPDRNNIRWVVSNGSNSGNAMQQSNQQQQQQDLLPTPHYNAAVVHDMMLLLQQQQLLQAVAAAGGTSFTDALILFKAWAQQQGLTVQGVLPSDSRACYTGSSSSSSSAVLAAAAASQSDGLSGFLLAQLLAAAVSQAGPGAAAAMSPLQKLRCVLQLLADKQTWAKGGLALPRNSSVPAELKVLQQLEQQHQQGGGTSAAAAAVAGQVSKDHAKLTQKLQQQLQQLPAPAVSSAAFKKAYDVVILDPSGHLNLAANVSKSNLQLAQMAAARSLAILNRQQLEADVVYAAVFRPNQGLAGVFDYWWTVELPQQQQQQLGDQHPMRLEEVQVEGLVRKALTTRAVLVKAVRRPPTYLTQQQQQQRQRHATAAAAGAVGVPRRLVVAVVVDAVSALRAVDVGPAADDAAAAAKFRALWGDKAELRRFQDGKINEALVWEGVPPGERHRIPDLAVQHLLLRHLPGGTAVQSCSTALDVLLYPGSTPGGTSGKAHGEALTWTTVQAVQAGQAVQSPGSTVGSTTSTAVAVGGSSGGAAAAATAASRAADTALDTLAKQLRGLTDVALKVIGVQSVSAVNRHTACFYPKPHPLAEGSRVVLDGVEVPRVLEPVEVVVQLEGSGRMPSDPTAFAKTKAALGVQLAAALTAACGAHVTATEEALEVLWEGVAFKLLLYMDRDQPTLAAAAAAAAAGGAAAAAAAAAAGSHVPLPPLLSRHHGMIAALDAAHAAYGPTVRLAKRWLGLQLLLGPAQVCEEAVELLVAAVFQGPSTTQQPASRISGLLRFLHLLAHHCWAAAPLLVDSLGEASEEAIRQLQVAFEARRTAGSAPGMFLATPYDMTSSRWTAHHPTPAVTHHLVALARNAWQQLSQLLLLGADAATAQQQLLLLTAHQTKKKLKMEADITTALPQQQQQQEMTALARAWRSVTGPSLSGFDAWVVLRSEALPFSHRADPLAAAMLQQQLKQQRRKKQQLLAGDEEAAAAAGDQGGKSRKRPLKGSRNGAAAAGAAAAAAARGALVQLLDGVYKSDAPKASRALLRNIPQQVCISKPLDKLRGELLVGFDPISTFLQLCNERYGHVATFCADPLGGFGAVGVKWKPEAFLPGPLNPNHAHGMMELGVTCSTGNSGQVGRKSEKGVRQGQHVGLVVPNVGQILSEVCEMGVGLVQEVVLLD